MAFLHIILVCGADRGGVIGVYGSSWRALMFRFFIAILKNGHNSEINARSRNAALMGRVTKIRKFPSDIRRDRLRLLSAMGPKIRANTIGAMGIDRKSVV